MSAPSRGGAFDVAPSAVVWVIAHLGCCILASLILGCGKGSGDQFVVCYTSQDQVYAEEIFQEFTKETGIAVRPVFDSEAAKTVGLVNRLLAEKDHPQCDVFWNNEALRTYQLAARGCFRETNGWAALGGRSRRLTIDTNRLALAEAPKSWAELTNARWHGKVALSYPLSGTTATHFIALRRHWGVEPWREWCRALAESRPLLVDGNSVAARMVSSGQALVGMTDSDDIAAENREGRSLVALPLAAESLLIPNTVAVTRGAPHPGPAQALFDFLQRPDVVQRLVQMKALEFHEPEAAASPGLKVDWARLAADVPDATEELKRLFLR